jgi:hypothetical protein
MLYVYALCFTLHALYFTLHALCFMFCVYEEGRRGGAKGREGKTKGDAYALRESVLTLGVVTFQVPYVANRFVSGILLLLSWRLLVDRSFASLKILLGAAFFGRIIWEVPRN